MVFLCRHSYLDTLSMEYLPSTTLSLDSTLCELPSIDSSTSAETSGEEVMKIFKANPANPGVIVMKGETIAGLISREAFFETTGKRFGVEIYLGRSIATMLELFSSEPLILPESEKISHAIHEALRRDTRSVYDPIIVKKTEGGYRVIDILSVFLAENQILLTLHNQHTFTVSSGIKLTDKEAIFRFIEFTGIKELKDPTVLIKRNSIICDKCGKKIEYSIPDIVRSHPQLTRGIEVISKMGNRSYIFYVKHTCGNEIREIPVHHDCDLNLRALRPSRLVETYVEL